MPPLGNQLTVAVEMIHPLIVRFHHNDISRTIRGHSLCLAKIRLGHLPLHQETPIRAEFLNPSSDVRHIKIVIQIASQGSRLVELSGRNTA